MISRRGAQWYFVRVWGEEGNVHRNRRTRSPQGESPLAVGPEKPARSVPWAALLLLAPLLGCPPSLGDDDDATPDDDDATSDDDDATSDDDDATSDDDDDATSDDDDVTGDDDDSTGTRPRDLQLCAETSPANVSVNNATLDGAILTLDVSYGGGCEVHDIELCWDGSFLESWPVQVTLVPQDWGPPDPCDGWMSETVTIDLWPLQRAWDGAYGPPPGTIAINLEGFGLTFQF